MLDEFYHTIVEANEPSMLNEDDREMLDRINAYRMESRDDDLSIIMPEELDLLSIAKSSSPTKRQ